MQAVIRTTKDFKEIARLNKSVQDWHQQNYPEVFKPFDLKAIEKALQAMLEKDKVFAFVAELNGNPVGYLLAYLEHRSESAFQYAQSILNIDQILVLEKYRGSGIGKALIDRAIELAKEKQVDEIQLDHWSANQSAEHFFAMHGFEYFRYKMRK